MMVLDVTNKFPRFITIKVWPCVFLFETEENFLQTNLVLFRKLQNWEGIRKKICEICVHLRVSHNFPFFILEIKLLRTQLIKERE